MERENEDPYLNKTLITSNSSYTYCSPFKVDCKNRENATSCCSLRLSPLIPNKVNSSSQIEDIRSDIDLSKYSSLPNLGSFD